MLNKNMSKKEINNFLENKGDFVKIDYLSKYLEKEPALEMKKFVLLKLSEIYEKKAMYDKSAKISNSLAIFSIAFTEKIKYYIKEAEFYILANNFEKADNAIKKALSEANSSQRAEIYFNIKQFYKNTAEKYEKIKKRNNALRLYEKLFEMNLSEKEKNEIKEKLIKLYNILGKFEELKRLQKLDRNL